MPRKIDLQKIHDTPPRFMSAYLDKECAFILTEIKRRIEAVGGNFVFSAFMRKLVQQYGEADISDVDDIDKMKDIVITDEMQKYYKLVVFHSWDSDYMEVFNKITKRIEDVGGNFVFSVYIRKLIKKYAKNIGSI